MAAPNLKNPTTITGKTARYAVTATLANALANSAASGKVFKINSIFCANVTAALIATWPRRLPCLLMQLRLSAPKKHTSI
jgi:hypothetical protein